MVKKKDGIWRLCVDYRALNAITIKGNFPIAIIDEHLDEFGGKSIFSKINLRSKIDLHSSYHQMRVWSEDTHKTTFRTFDGHYKFPVMPFGLANPPSTFQSTMSDFL